jgi:hypothetical protein
MKRKQLWELLREGPAEYRPFITGALLHDFEFSLIDPGQKANTVPIEAIDDRWVALVRDQRPPSFESRGPTAFSWTLLKRLAQRATFAFTIGIDDEKLYRELARSALMGARILIVNTDPNEPTLDDWEDFLDEYEPGRAVRRRASPRTRKRLMEMGAFGGA